MITGVHTLIYSDRADEVRAFVRDVLGFGHVDVGHGWLIFALPPSELAVHPADGSSPRCELYLMCDDVEKTMADLAAKGAPCDPIQEERWGRVTHLALPDGTRLGLYQPRHPLPPR
jgi:catechol 2,3-dioxygenase-like lactoylglutathione lyase family enzyme